MGLRRWIFPAVLVVAFFVALLIPGSRDVAVMARRIAVESLPWHVSLDNTPFGELSAEEVAELHKDDPIILLGAAEISRDPKMFDRALKLNPNDPVMHARIVSISLQQWTSELGKKNIFQPDSSTQKLMEIVSEHSNWGMAHEPDNAFFYYTKACVDGVMGDKKSALDLFVAGSQKPYINTYTKEAEQAILKASLASRMTRFQSQTRAAGCWTPYIGAFPRLSTLVADEARRADSEGRPDDALSLHMAVFETGKLFFESTDSGYLSAWSYWIMHAAGPQAPVRHTVDDWETIQWPLFRDYLLSHNVSKVKVDSIHDTILTALRLRSDELIINRLFGAQYRVQSGVFLASLFLFLTIGFGALWLLLWPVVKFATGEVRATGWSMWTSIVLWTLLLTILVVPLFSSLCKLSELYTRLSIKISPLFIYYIMMILAVITAVMLTGTVISLSRRWSERTSRRKLALSGVVLTVLLLIEVFWTPHMTAMYGNTFLTEIGLWFVLMFSILRGWVISRRCGGTAAGHFLTSLLASCRAVAVGSVVAFVAGLYITLPFYNKAVHLMDLWLNKGLNPMTLIN